MKKTLTKQRDDEMRALREAQQTIHEALGKLPVMGLTLRTPNTRIIITSHVEDLLPVMIGKDGEPRPLLAVPFGDTVEKSGPARWSMLIDAEKMTTAKMRKAMRFFQEEPALSEEPAPGVAGKP